MTSKRIDRFLDSLTTAELSDLLTSVKQRLEDSQASLRAEIRASGGIDHYPDLTTELATERMDS